MLTRRLPSADRMDSLVEREGATPLTYPVGLTQGPRPRRWFVEDVDAILGVGLTAYDAACTALRAWEHTDLGWFVTHQPDATPITEGQVVASSTRALGCWWSYCCRIVTVIDETDQDGRRRFGYVYGTIGRHAERGEEEVLVTFDPTTAEVHGSILAISRPGRWFTWAGLPFARRTQVRFKPDALAALARSVRRRLNP